jgi:hypothetical protein
LHELEHMRNCSKIDFSLRIEKLNSEYTAPLTLNGNYIKAS